MRLKTVLIASIVMLAGAAAAASANEGEWRHGATLFGDLKYGPDFQHYDHVNSDAPKGGRLNQAVQGSYDSFNPFVLTGLPAAGLNGFGGLLYDTLFEQSVDQPSASYGLVAESFRYPADFSSATFRINPDARFHDGEPIKPEDVVWSLEVLKENHPRYANYYRNVSRAEKTGDREVTFYFDTKGNRELPQIMGDLPVLPKHWWLATGANGEERNITEPIAEPPLGSGPYRIADHDLGKDVTWERVEDYWAADLPVRVGRYNFDEIRYTYFLDSNAIWEAFKKGGLADTRVENVSRRWATEYTFPAFKRGDVVKEAFETSQPQPFQGYFFNTRLEKFKDVRVRKALTLLFDFETMNRTLFFGSYDRTDSYFEGGELQAREGAPDGRVKEILEEYRGRIADEVIDEAFELPVYDDRRARREYRAEAVRLLKEAGYSFDDGRLVDENGRPLQIEILGNSPTDERIGIPTAEYFKPLGIDVQLRTVDAAQYVNRIDDFDFEMTMLVTAQSLSPGNEQREYWTAQAAAASGTRNYSGISDPVIDELVERIIAAPDREELVALTRALDRMLLWGYYAIPMWHNPDEWFAWWSRIEFPEEQPLYSGVDLFSAWIDPEKAEAGQ